MSHKGLDPGPSDATPLLIPPVLSVTLNYPTEDISLQECFIQINASLTAEFPPTVASAGEVFKVMGAGSF